MVERGRRSRTTTGDLCGRAPPALALLVAGLAGCSRPGPQLPPFPEFDASQPFPELKGRSESEGEERQHRPRSRFDDRMSAAKAKASGEPRHWHSVTLGGRFVSEVPAAFDEWKRTELDDSTVLVHRKPGQPPDAVVLAKAFDGTLRMATLEHMHFLVGLDPRLVASPELESVARWIDLATDGIETLSNSPSFDIGFHSDPETFTGWRWVGRNEGGVVIRLGSVRGRWAPEATTGADAEPVVAAYMLVGSAVFEGSVGIHLAVVCSRTPKCTNARELGHLLDGIRLPKPDEIESAFSVNEDTEPDSLP